MRYLRAVMIAVALLLALPLAARENVYFSVSSNKTFKPDEKVSVQVYAQDVDVLEFRVYRINDPVKFFQQLKDVHGFGPGASSTERIDERTPLERFHDWKHRYWVRVRNFFRGQFSAESRATIRDRQAEKVKRSRVSNSAGFAQVPLLNPTQLVARWRVDLPPKYFSESTAVPIESLESGAYLLEATDGTYKAYTVILVGSMALITKTSPGHALAYAVDRSTGAPLEGCAVTVWAGKQVRARFTTGANGVGQAGVAAPQRGEEFGSEGDWILGVRGKEVAMVAPYSLNLSSNPARDWVGYVYTDRPVYRPGHTVYLKAILRKRNGDALALPSETSVQIRVQAPDETAAFDQRVQLSASGTARAQFELPAKAALGYYNIDVNIGQGHAGGSFYVEEYKKPEYKVTVTSERARVLQGDVIRATIDARYYFGEPVANAKVKYVVHTARAWSFWDYEEEENDSGEQMGGEDEGGYDYAGEQVSEQEGQLDANGRLVVSIPTRVVEKSYDVTYRVEARVTDPANREIAGHGSVLATYGSFRVRVQPQSYVYTGVQPVQLTVEAQDYDQHPIQTPIKVEFRTHPYSREEAVELTVDQQTGADGKAMFSVTPPRAGSFRVVVTAKTPEGREVEGTTWIWVAGPGQGEWEGTRQVQIVPDKKSYKVGDTARLLVLNGVAGAHMLITSEAQTVLSAQVIEAKDTNTTVEVPITNLAPPNFHVSVVFMNQDQLYSGTKSLNVPPVEKRLRIEIQPSKPQFQPGEDASFAVRATDYTGKPVAAEFSIGVVDDALYAVRPDNSGDIVNAFYERRYYSAVTTENSLTFAFHGEAGKRSLQLASGAPGGGRLAYRARMAQIKPGADLVMPKVRKAFPDTAFWTAEARTDSNGRGVVHLTFPDSLTTWRATVRAITADTRAGAEIARVVVRKNVIVRIAAPRFFRAGDEVTVSAIAHNYLDAAKQAHVSLDITGVDVLSGSAQTISLPSRGDAKLDWRVRARNGSQVKLLAQALTNQESDALEISLPVIPFGVKMTTAVSGTLESSGSKQLNLDFPAQSEPTSRTLEVSLAPSIAGAIFSALDYLTTYPYGCTEQTMSSFLPNVIVARAMRDLNLKSNVDEAALRDKIDAGLERLYDFQHDDGGWGWWKEDASMVFMTSYVVSGLSQASAAGYKVRPGVIAKGKEFLREQLREHPRMIADLQAYVTYALVQNGERDRGLVDAAWEKKDKLSPQGVALVGLAMHTLGDARANEAAEMLQRTAKQEGETTYWPASYDYLLDVSTDDSAEATAFAMRLLSAVNPQNPLLPKAAVWLVQHRRDGAYWDSTKQTAMVIYGITDFVKSSRELQPNFTAEVLVNGKSVSTRKFTAADAMAKPAVVELPASALAASNKVEVRKAGGGRLYWSARGQYYSTDKKLYQSGQLSLNITRDYFRLKSVKTEQKIYYELEPLSGPVQIGDVIAVRVSINGGRWKYLLMEDPIPAGAEFIQRDDLYEVRNKPAWWQYWFSRREFHDDRAAIFQTEFDGRQAQAYFYLLKIVNPGMFRISPALVQPMYQPDVISTTEPATLEVK